MSKTRQNQAQKREAPVQLRPGSELGQMVKTFAEAHQIQPNEACKRLLALAVMAMDRRYYGLVDQLAGAMGGANAFVRACVHVQTALEGVALATGRTSWVEPERSRFILQIVRDFLVGKGLEVQTQGLWFVPEETGTQQQSKGPDQTKKVERHQKKRRTIRPEVCEEQEQPTEQPATTDQREGEALQAETSAVPEETQPQRIGL